MPNIFCVPKIRYSYNINFIKSELHRKKSAEEKYELAEDLGEMLTLAPRRHFFGIKFSFTKGFLQ